MKSLTLLWKEIAEESAIRCCTSATMDIKTVHRRVEHEGLSFLTITLPTFGKEFQKALDLGYVDRRLFTGFQWKGGLPRFLGGFLDRVFDRGSGALLDEPDIDAILAVRQLTLMFNKILLPCSDAREKDAIDGYIKCEQEVRIADQGLSRHDSDDFCRISALLFRSAFSEADREVAYGNVVPKHGPGATADGLSGNGKYRQSTWTERLERVFPSSDHLLPSPSYYDELFAVSLLEPGSEMPVKVISVPKTLKTPRIIAKEPTAMQYMQQGVSEVIRAALKRHDYLDRMVGIDDQTPNQRMALDGSLHGNLATLDLSEASDRVSNQLVRMLFANHLHLHEAVDATRSRKAEVPGHGVIRLAKFASMGSALTFPVEAMVFLTLCFIGIERELSAPLRLSDVKRLKDEVRVYGDDIIVPVDFVHSVVRVLEDFGLRVNTDKSFWTGKFRESCGRDYYDGVDVSVVRVRRVFPTRREHATEVISIVSLRNQLYYAGYWKTCQWLDQYIRKVIRHFPVVEAESPVLGRESFLGHETQRIGEHLHNPLVKGYVVSSRIPSDPLDGPGALLKCFLKRGSLPSADVKHLERAGRPHAVDIKLRWASAI